MTPTFQAPEAFAVPVGLIRFNCQGNVVELIRDYSPRMYLVRYTGKTPDGRFNGMRNLMMTVLKSNCTPLERGQL